MKLNPGSEEAQKFVKRMVRDLEAAPDYKTEAAKAESYFDSLQLPVELRQFMEDRGQPVIVNNLIQPIINGVLGMEAKTRTDFVVKSDDEEGVEVVEALNEKLNENVRISRVHRATSDAFKRQVIGGLGWVEVRRNPDPFGNDYITEEVDYREVSYDWRCKNADLSDCRYVARERWVDEDELKTNFPQHESLIVACINGTGLVELDNAGARYNVAPDLVGTTSVELQSQFDQYGGTFVNEDRRQAKLTLVQYRVPRRGYMIKVGKVRVEYDEKNPVHQAALATGKAQVWPATYTKMRHAWFLGPHLIDDSESPYPHNMFSLVPFWGFKEGGTGKPYGLVRNMMSAQDEVNFRRSMLAWLLKARLVVKEQDAVLESDDELHTTIKKMDGVINLNPNRKNRTAGLEGSFKIVNEVSVAQNHFSIMQDAMKQLQDLVGVYSSFLGQDSNASSGIAINSLVEQATVTLSDLFDNFQFGRQRVAELMLALIEEDIGNEETEISAYVNETRATKTITLNKRSYDERGGQTVSNRVANLKKHVVLADIQKSPGYRAQQLQQLMELAGTLPDQAKLILLEDIILLTDVPRKGELVNKIKQAIGLGVDESQMSDEEKQANAEKQAQAKKEVEMVMRERNAEISGKEADAGKKVAETDLLNRRVAALDSTQKLDDARAAEIMADIEGKDIANTMARKQSGEEVESEIDRLLSQI